MDSDQDRQHAPIWRSDEDGTPTAFRWEAPSGATTREETGHVVGRAPSPFTTATLTCCLFLFSLGLGAGLRGESSPRLALPSFTETGEGEDSSRVVLETDPEPSDGENRKRRIKLAVKPRTIGTTSAPDTATVKGLVVARASSAPATAPVSRPLDQAQGGGAQQNGPDASPGDGRPDVPPITNPPDEEPPSEPVEPEKPESPPPPGDETDEVDEEPDDIDEPEEVEEPVVDGPGNSENAPGHNKDGSPGNGRGPK